MNEASSSEKESVSSILPPPSRSVWSFLKTSRGKLLIGLVGLVVLTVVLIGQVYARPVTDPFVRAAASVIPFPALSVDRNVVTISNFLTEYDALGSYFTDAGQEAPPAQQLEIAVADTFVNKLAIQNLAKQYEIEIDSERVDEYYQDVIAQDGEEAFAQNLTETFGWSTDEFKKRIVESIVLALQMTDAILADQETQQSRRDLMDAAYARVQNGEDFATVAKDAHAGFDGIESDLGYVKASVIPASWSDQVIALEEGEMTEVIELPEGFVLFKLEEKILAGEDTQFHLLSITIPKVSLEEVVDEYLTTVEVKRYVGKE